MIDVNKITSTLAKLPDAQLQQYAQMHKADPYIMALALSESNRRKEMRSAGQGVQGMQEQPKVVDQMVAEMAPRPPQPMPEDQGIARIPAGEMNFAGGGIVAFADGGDVERYQVGGAIQNRYQQESQEMVSGNRVQYSPDVAAYAQQLSAQESAARNAAENTFLKAEQQRMLQGPYAAPAASQRPTMANDPRLDTPRPADDSFRRQTDPRMLGMAATPAAQPLITSGAAPRVDTTQRSLSGGPKATSAAAATPAAGLDALDPNKLFATALADANKAPRPEKEMLEALNAERKTAAESELSGVKALNEKFADAFKGRRERLDTREGAIGKMKDQNFGLALLQAGAAIMSTPGNLGTAIGKGVQTGSQQYVAGIDKINTAKDKLADARDRLDDLQLNRDEMSAREILKAENKIRDTALSGQENMIKFVMERDKVNRETAAKIVDSQIQLGITKYKEEGANVRTDKEIQGRITAAKLGNQPPAQMQIAMALGGGDLEKGFKKIKEIEAGKFSVSNSYADYLKAFAGKEGLTPPLSFANYAAQFGATLPR